MGAEVVHEEVVGVVDKEMQSVNHFSVVTYQGHFDGLFHDFDNSGFGFSFLLEQFNLHLLFAFLEQELGFTEDLFTFFQGLVDQTCGLEHINVVAVSKLLLLLFKEFSAMLCLLIKLLSFQLNVDKVSVFE